MDNFSSELDKWDLSIFDRFLEQTTIHSETSGSIKLENNTDSFSEDQLGVLEGDEEKSAKLRAIRVILLFQFLAQEFELERQEIDFQRMEDEINEEQKLQEEIEELEHKYSALKEMIQIKKGQETRQKAIKRRYDHFFETNISNAFLTFDEISQFSSWQDAVVKDQRKLKILHFVLNTLGRHPPRHAKDFSDWIMKNRPILSSED